jgi:putative transcriptional regulator
MDAPIFLSGQLLLAMPGIGDSRFEKAVIALCVHDEAGALGIGLGRVIPRIHFHELLGQFEIDPGVAPDVPIHLGGPVEPQRGFILHSPDWGGEDSVHVGSRWVLSATIDILRAIA